MFLWALNRSGVIAEITLSRKELREAAQLVKDPELTIVENVVLRKASHFLGKPPWAWVTVFHLYIAFPPSHIPQAKLT